MPNLEEDLEYNRRYKEVLHIFNVSLKNNKGLEIVKSFIKAVIEYYDYAIELYFKKLYENKKIDEIPDSPIKRYKKIIEIIKDKEFEESLKYYKLLKLALNADAKIINEYRKSMVIKFKTMGGEEFEINIKMLKDITESVKKFSTIISKYM
jgi:hypothetical protein